MTVPEFIATSWRKSSRSNTGANCVEIAFGDHVVGVRDSKNSDKNILIFSSDQWQNFIRRVKDKKFDL